MVLSVSALLKISFEANINRKSRLQDYLAKCHLTGAVAQRCSVKKVFVEVLQNSQENTCVRVSSLIKLQASAYNLIKEETLAQVFSYEFCQISKNSFSYRTPPVAASDLTTV